jgi:hypothetical protein
MAKAKRYRHITIHPSQGGALIGSTSDDIPLTQESNYLASSANYTEKLNFRREVDGEVRREGWELFSPTGTDDAISSQFPIRGIHQFTGSDGTPLLIAISGNKVLKLESGDRRFAINYGQDFLNSDPIDEYATFDGIDAPEPSLASVDYFNNDADDFTWSTIYTFESHMDAKEADGTYKDPFEGGAYRWEFVEIRNHLIINNGIDLPIVYKSEYDLAYPLYGLRENGVMSVGTIANFQDRLFCGDLTVISSGFDNWFEQASDPYATFTSSHPLLGVIQTQRYQYRIVYSAEGDPKLFNAGIEEGSSIISESGGLPGTLTVNSSGEYLFNYTYDFAIDTPASLYQERNFGIFGGDEHVGLFLDSLGAIKFDDENFTSQNRVEALKRLDAKFPGRNASIGSAFPNDAGDFLESEILVEQISAIETSGIFFEKLTGKNLKFINKDGANIQILDPHTGLPLAGGTYSMVLRPYAEQTRRPAQFQEFSQDGTRILKMKELADKLVVYRDSGFFFLTNSNSTLQPFAVDPRYTGGRNADFRNTVIQVSGNHHLFMGNSGVYKISRSSTEPQPVGTFELGPTFWQMVPPELSEFVYAVDNPVTREIFINCPLGYKKNSKDEYVDDFGDKLAEGVQPILDWGVIAYDYINETLSQIDASFTSCAVIRKPKVNRIGPEQSWFIMGVHQGTTASEIYVGTQWREDPQYGGVLVRYGYGPPIYGNTEPYRIYNRIGYGYLSKIRSGLIDFGDSFSDKEVRSYVLELSSKYQVAPIRVKISTTTAPQGTEQVETMSVVDGVTYDYVTLNQLKDENMIPLYLRAPYIRDEISVLPQYETSSANYIDTGYVKEQTMVNSDGIQVASFYVTSSQSKVIDNPVKLVGRTFEATGIDTRATTQATGQG